MMASVVWLMVGAPAPSDADVWLAFVGDRTATGTEAHPTERVDPVLGMLAQADLALDVAVQQIALPKAGIDWRREDGTKRFALPGGCVAVVPVTAAADVATLKSEADAGCFVVAVLRWEAPVALASGMPDVVEARAATALRIAGVGLVVGHHAGPFGGVGWRDRMPVLWNVGTFFDGFDGETTNGGIFRVRLTPTKKGYRLAEVDLKPYARDAKTGRLRPPKEKEMAAISQAIIEKTRRARGRAKLEAAHIVFIR